MAFLFPGQGSQKVGMGQALVQAFPAARAVFDEVDAALGFSLSRLCFEGPEAELTLTANAQPAILTTSIAALRVLEQETSLRPVGGGGAFAGRVLGAGLCRRPDAWRTRPVWCGCAGSSCRRRCPPGPGGWRPSWGWRVDEVNAACQEAMDASPAGQPEIVAAANLNGGGQIVIAGHKAAVERACAAAKRRGAKAALPLAVSAPFHSALMQPAAERLALELAKVTVRDPSVPVVTNVEASPNQDGAADARPVDPAGYRGRSLGRIDLEAGKLEYQRSD